MIQSAFYSIVQMQGVQGQREDDDDGAEFSFAGSHSI
jgi:hypothetical protein